MPPGWIFAEAELAADLQMSKTPVREALLKLEREGLVTVRARTRWQVAPVVLKDIRDLFALRTLLEGEVASLAATRLSHTSQLQELEELCKESYVPEDPSSIATFLAANRRFHLTVAAASGNDRLVAALQGVLEHMDRLFHIGLFLMPRPDDMPHEHGQLVNAIIRGDSDLARKVAVDQCRASQQMVVDAVLTSGALDAINVWPAATSSRRTGDPPASRTS